MKNFEFKSAICTSIEQSKRLLVLGLKKETADMMIITKSNHIPHEPRIIVGYDYKLSTNEAFDTLPAWSLHRLLCLYGLDYTIKEVYNSAEECYGMLICAIEIAIEEGYFNKDYLEEKK